MRILIGFLISLLYLFFPIWKLLQLSYVDKNFACKDNNSFYNILTYLTCICVELISLSRLKVYLSMPLCVSLQGHLHFVSIWWLWHHGNQYVLFGPTHQAAEGSGKPLLCFLFLFSFIPFFLSFVLPRKLYEE